MGRQLARDATLKVEATRERTHNVMGWQLEREEATHGGDYSRERQLIRCAVLLQRQCRLSEEKHYSWSSTPRWLEAAGGCAMQLHRHVY